MKEANNNFETEDDQAVLEQELVALAKQNGVSGIRNLSKAQLIDTIRRRDGVMTESSLQSESKQMELSSWSSSPTIHFSESSLPNTNNVEKIVELGGIQEEDTQLNLLDSLEELDDHASFVQ